MITTNGSRKVKQPCSCCYDEVAKTNIQRQLIMIGRLITPSFFYIYSDYFQLAMDRTLWWQWNLSQRKSWPFHSAVVRRDYWREILEEEVWFSHLDQSPHMNAGRSIVVGLPNMEPASLLALNWWLGYMTINKLQYAFFVAWFRAESKCCPKQYNCSNVLFRLAAGCLDSCELDHHSMPASRVLSLVDALAGGKFYMCVFYSA